MTITTVERAKSLRLHLQAAAIALLAVASPASVGAHPHDLLAQCQLKDGSWKMCSETIHDLAGAHVPAARPASANRLTITPPPATPSKSTQ